MLSEEKDKARFLGPYEVFREVARGALASVHLGRLRGNSEPTPTVAIKRLYPVFAEDPEFAEIYADQARRVARVRHPNVLSVLEVESTDGELLQVTEYVLGESLSHLIRLAGKQRIAMPRRVFVTIMVGILAGLEAAHEARDASGAPAGVVHGDLSPHDVLIGLEGLPKISNFGLSKGLLREQGAAESAQIRSKHAYMAPEQLRGGVIDRRADVYSAGVMLWEGLTGRRLFDPKSVPEASDIMARTQPSSVKPPSSIIASTPKVLDEIVMKALEGSPDDRFKTAGEMGKALEAAVPAVPARLIGEWVGQVAGDALRERAAEVSEMEGTELTVVSARPPHLPLMSFIDLGAFAGPSNPPADADIQGDPALRIVPPPPLVPRPAKPLEGVSSAPPKPLAASSVPPKHMATPSGSVPSLRLPLADKSHPHGSAPKRVDPTTVRPPRQTSAPWIWLAGIASAAIVIAAAWVVGAMLGADGSDPPESIQTTSGEKAAPAAPSPAEPNKASPASSGASEAGQTPTGSNASDNPPGNPREPSTQQQGNTNQP